MDFNSKQFKPFNTPSCRFSLSDNVVVQKNKIFGRLLIPVQSSIYHDSWW